MLGIKIISQSQKLVLDPASQSIGVVNTGPQGPAGVPGPSEASLVLVIDGQLLTRSGGDLAPITRANLANDSAFTSKFLNATSAAGAPGGTGSNGDLYWDSTNKFLYRSNGSNWFPVIEPKVIPSSSLPTTSFDGDLASLSDGNQLAQYDTTNATWNAFPKQDGFPNGIINGGFDVWQRGLSGFGSSSAVTADMWELRCNGSSHATTANLINPGSDYGTNDRYFSSIVVTSVAGAGNFAVYTNKIENVRRYAGKTVVVSFWANTNGGASRDVCISMEQAFGSGGSANVDTPAASKNLITSTAKRHYAVVNVPSISGKTINETNSALYLNVWLDAGSNFNSRTNSLGQGSRTLNIWGVKLEEGVIPTPYESVPIPVTLELCKRYYRRFGGSLAFELIALSGFTANTTAASGLIALNPAMRAVPTVSGWGNLQIYCANNNSYALTALSVNTAVSTPQLVGLDLTTAAHVANLFCYIRANNNAAGYLALTAEL